MTVIAQSLWSLMKSEDQEKHPASRTDLEVIDDPVFTIYPPGDACHHRVRPHLAGGGHRKRDHPEAVGNRLAQEVGLGSHEIELNGYSRDGVARTVVDLGSEGLGEFRSRIA